MDIGKLGKNDKKDFPPVETSIKKIVKDELQLDPDQINKREQDVPQFDPKQVYNKSVILIGTGGVGSLLSFYLTKLGVDLVMIDHDKISVSNLNRSLFLPKDTGRSKPLALVDLLAQFRTTEKQRITGYALPFDEFKKSYEEVLRNSDVIIAAVDNNKTVYQITKFCMENSISLIVSGVSSDSNFVKVFWDAPWADGGCYRCFHPDDSKSKGGEPRCEGCEDEIHPSICFPHAIVAGLVTHVVKAVLMEEKPGYRELLLNIKEGGTSRRNIDPREDCEICKGSGLQ